MKVLDFLDQTPSEAAKQMRAAGAQKPTTKRELFSLIFWAVFLAMILAKLLFWSIGI